MSGRIILKVELPADDKATREQVLAYIRNALDKYEGEPVMFGAVPAVEPYPYSWSWHAETDAEKYRREARVDLIEDEIDNERSE